MYPCGVACSALHSKNPMYPNYGILRTQRTTMRRMNNEQYAGHKISLGSFIFAIGQMMCQQPKG
jgi:hypothetical protein